MIKTIFPHFNHSSSTAWIERIIPQDRCSPGWEAGLHHMTWSLIRRGVMMTQSLSIQGAENFPTEGPVVIVANHSSHLDTLLLGAAVPRLVRSRFSPLAAGDTFFVIRLALIA